MRGACSRKRDPQITKTSAQGVISRKYSKSGNSKWLGTSFSRASIDNKDGNKYARHSWNYAFIKILRKLISEYPSVDDNWLGVESSQGLSLLFADLSGSEVTDISLCHVKDCKNVEDLNLNFCDMISDVCVGCISEESSQTGTSHVLSKIPSYSLGIGTRFSTLEFIISSDSVSGVVLRCLSPILREYSGSSFGRTGAIALTEEI
nr:hypothetical protein [Tanacetum cinerariifolium]